MADGEAPKRNVPLRRKGGTRYPKHSLDQVLGSSSKLVSKTHLGAITKDILFAGVLGTTGSTAEIKASSLKQFGLLEGQSDAYTATSLAKSINSSPPEEINPLLQEAALTPVVFQQLYETFHGDHVAISKIRQRAIELKVHPDLAAECVAKYMASLSEAKLGTADGSSFAHKERSASTTSDNGEAPVEAQDNNADDLYDGHSKNAADDKSQDTSERLQENGSTPRAIFHVNVNLDASLDTDKLERHLKLLKQYGAI